ncbi:SMUG2 DNA glycosylase family protein [Niastella caeni]|uniref:SMUG2 DNA glycosylase family protein n=1 Tax=Niastella caeni TaxID=2569763 RepID=A0A4S8HCC3_9BACT|nr:uracil-DNA glycosylase family protein [Niastella caeni]THU32433.1 SMUG2 DNA glycosylase family protein [Niastella caeni]
MNTAAEKITQSNAILNFYKSLSPNLQLPPGVQIMNPFADAASWQLTETFYNKFYNDHHPRTFIFGINPGRFGGGVTGIPFTDPVRLKEECGIHNELPMKAELSSHFIYAVIAAYGGPEAFYHDFFITALSPLGFTKNGTNLNYYDDAALLKDSEPFIVQCIKEQLKTIVTTRDVCYCLGEGTNFKIFQRLNAKHSFFKEIIPLPHPRWVMQYRRKKIPEFVDLYVKKLRRSM